MRSLRRACFEPELERLGYPRAAISSVAFAFESQETVDRRYQGNWWHAMR